MAVQWENPKTNWAIRYDAYGKYAGDYINYSDYNRIKNNIAYVQTLAERIAYDTYPSMGADKTSWLQYPRASEWNAIETALKQLANNIQVYFQPMLFYDNGKTPDVDELNRIESMTLRLKGQYETAIAMNYKLALTLGRDRSVIRT